MNQIAKVKSASIETTLEKLGDWGSGGTPSRSQPEFFGGEISWVKIGDLNDGLISQTEESLTQKGLKSSAAKLIPPGAVLIAMYGASIGKLGVTAIHCCTNQAIAHCLPNSEAVETFYLFYFLLHNRPLLVQLGKGAAQPNISQTVLKKLKILLPPLPEQQRIVAQIKDCLDRIDEISQLHHENTNAIWSLKRSLVFGEQRSDRNWVELSELVDWIHETEAVSETETYHFAGAKSFGKGLFHSATRTGQDFKYKEVRRLQHRDFIYPKLMAWEGGFGMVPKEFDGFVVSPEFVVFRTKDGIICPEVLDTYFRSPLCLDDVRNASTGSNKRRRRLNPKAFLKLKVPVPLHDVQEQLKKVYEFEAKAAESWQDLPKTLEKIRQDILKKAFSGEL